MSSLKKLEATIRRGQKAFFETARALLEIDRRKLWKPHFSSVVEYAADRFDFSDCDVTRYRNAGLVIENLSEFEQVPINECQCRELSKLKYKESQVNVWRAVLDSEEKITAKLIANIAKRLLGGGDPDSREGSTQPVEDRTAIHEIVSAVRFLQAAKDRVETLDEEGRRCLLLQIEIVETEIEELRVNLGALSVAVAA